MTPPDLEVLACRVEALTGPDRATDYAVMCATVAPGKGYFWDPDDANHRYTASLDPALSLVREGWFTLLAMEDRHSHVWRWDLRGGFGIQVTALAVSPALALTAASLRALARARGGKGEG